MRKALILGLVTGLIMLIGSSARATTRDITDPSGDVLSFTDETFTRVGGAEGDIVFARIRHTATQMIIYLRLRQLTVPQQYGGFGFLIQGSSRRTWLEAGIGTRHGDPQGDSYAYADRNCSHSYHINYAGDSAWIRIARSCLKNPKYIRVAASSERTRIHRDVATNWFDNAANDGQHEDTWSPWVVTD